MVVFKVLLVVFSARNAFRRSPDFIIGRLFPHGGLWGRVLYTTSVVDGNNQIIPLAFSIGIAEDLDGWRYHDGHICTYFDECLTDFTLVSDRQKGLESDNTLQTFLSHHGMFVKHLVDNVCSDTAIPKKGSSSLIWSIAKYGCKDSITRKLEEIAEQYGVDAAAYIEDTGLRRCEAYWPPSTPRYDTFTSNTSECINSVFKEARQTSILGILRSIFLFIPDLYLFFGHY